MTNNWTMAARSFNDRNVSDAPPMTAAHTLAAAQQRSFLAAITPMDRGDSMSVPAVMAQQANEIARLNARSTLSQPHGGPGDMAATRKQGIGIPHSTNGGVPSSGTYQNEAPPGAHQQ